MEPDNNNTQNNEFNTNKEIQKNNIQTDIQNNMVNSNNEVQNSNMQPNNAQNNMKLGNNNQFNNIKTENSAIETNTVNKSADKMPKKEKYFVVVLLLGIIILVAFLAYYKLVGSVNLSWDESYLKNDTEYVIPTKVKLGVALSENEKIEDVKFESTVGNIEINGKEVIWDLSEATGTCEIKASYKLKNINKTLIVIPFEEEAELYEEYEYNIDPEDDLDEDGLTNKEEDEYKTNKLVKDTDLDGLDDNYEIKTSKTNPNNKDTDNDGIYDYDEIVLELNPLEEDSKKDGIKDGERDLSCNFESDQIKVNIKGKGNIASTKIEITPNTKISGKKGFIDKLYTFYTEGKLEKAEVKIGYTDDELNQYELTEENLSLYKYNIDDGKYEVVESKVDEKEKTIIAELDHFSHYVVGDSSVVKEISTNQVLFIIDNSWSMYSNEQCEQYSGEKPNETLDASDVGGLRFSITSEFASTLSNKGYEIGLSEFRYDYANAIEIGDNITGIKEKLKNMMGNFITKTTGTKISNALSKGIDEFTKESDNKYIIILTDGQDDTLKNYVSDIIKKAKKNNVIIYAIGFGRGSHNSELSDISNESGGKFYTSSYADGLLELFDNIEVQLDDNIIDVDNDGKNDGILLAENGFIVNRDGLSFNNYRSNLAKRTLLWICYIS